MFKDGRLSKEKGLKTLIDSFNCLPSFRLLIAGDGPLKLSIEKEKKDNTFYDLNKN